MAAGDAMAPEVCMGWRGGVEGVGVWGGGGVVCVVCVRETHNDEESRRDDRLGCLQRHHL